MHKHRFVQVNALTLRPDNCCSHKRTTCPADYLLSRICSTCIARLVFLNGTFIHLHVFFEVVSTELSAHPQQHTVCGYGAEKEHYTKTKWLCSRREFVPHVPVYQIKLINEQQMDTKGNSQFPMYVSVLFRPVLSEILHFQFNIAKTHITYHT